MLSAITSFDVSGYFADHIWDFILRLFCAAIAGFIIGFERKSRSKEAGVRTHTLVAIGAALMMIISKYAFADMLNGEAGARGADTARIAAQVVSGVGFLGAGIIMYRRDSLRGLTTAAGIWATAGLGLAFGSGMYVIGAVATVIILFTQLFLHLPIKIFKTRMFLVIHATIALNNEEDLQTVKEIFHVQRFLKFKTNKLADGSIQADLEMHTEMTYTAEALFQIAKDYPFILTIEQNEEI